LARILPYVEQTELWHLTEVAYQQDKSPAHDPPHIGLGTVVPVFICPSDTRTQTPTEVFGRTVTFTSFLGVEGLNLNTHDGILFLDSRIRITDIVDGTSQTLLVGERPPSADLDYGWWYAGIGQLQPTGSGDMVLGVREIDKHIGPNTQACPAGPYSYKMGRLDDQCDMFHFWSLHPGGGHFLFADGSVHFLSYDADAIMPALATRAGREPVSLPE
jgi:prepilin-type processing-associated H-X9-DG protein